MEKLDGTLIKERVKENGEYLIGPINNVRYKFKKDYYKYITAKKKRWFENGPIEIAHIKDSIYARYLL